MSQEEGLLGRVVAGMIRRSVRRCFRGVYLDPAVPNLSEGPFVFAANHHGWHDGYLMFHLVTHLGIRCLDWIEEFDAFPLFARVGGMPFPADRPEIRAATIKRTIRLMREEGRSLVLFPEGVLHHPPEILPFGRAIEVVAERTGALVVPVAIVYSMSMHERPEAFLKVGEPVPSGDDLAKRSRERIVEMAVCLNRDLRERPDTFQTLVRGTLDVNERWDWRRKRGR